MSRLRILLLEDSLLDAELTSATLTEGGFSCDLTRVETRDDFVRELGRNSYDLILADYALPAFDGLSALQLAARFRPELPFIFVSGTLGEDLAIESLKHGATDYVLKQRMQRLVPCVRRALREVEEQRELRHAHEALVATEKLAIVGRLAATIAHEINNPLEAVTNLLYLLELNPSLDDNARNLLSLAGRELARVAEISRQTLSFYRESSCPVDVHLDQVLESVRVLYQRRLLDSGVRLDLRACPAVIPGYPGEMRQLFSNLLTNAIEASGPGGRIVVRLRPARDWRSNAPGFRLTVADNGRGIPPHVLRRVFEPFFTTKGQHGTGLGLWVTHGIVAKHRGAIRVRSSVAPGRSGAVFSLFFGSASAGQARSVSSERSSMVA